LLIEQIVNCVFVNLRVIVLYLLLKHVLSYNLNLKEQSIKSKTQTFKSTLLANKKNSREKQDLRVSQNKDT